MDKYIYAGTCRICGEFKSAYDVYRIVDDKWGVAAINRQSLCKACNENKERV